MQKQRLSVLVAFLAFLPALTEAVLIVLLAILVLVLLVLVLLVLLRTASILVVVKVIIRLSSRAPSSTRMGRVPCRAAHVERIVVVALVHKDRAIAAVAIATRFSLLAVAIVLVLSLLLVVDVDVLHSRAAGLIAGLALAAAAARHAHLVVGDRHLVVGDRARALAASATTALGVLLALVTGLHAHSVRSHHRLIALLLATRRCHRRIRARLLLLLALALALVFVLVFLVVLVRHRRRRRRRCSATQARLRHSALRLRRSAVAPAAAADPVAPILEAGPVAPILEGLVDERGREGLTHRARVLFEGVRLFLVEPDALAMAPAVA